MSDNYGGGDDDEDGIFLSQYENKVKNKLLECAPFKMAKIGSISKSYLLNVQVSSQKDGIPQVTSARSNESIEPYRKDACFNSLQTPFGYLSVFIPTNQLPLSIVTSLDVSLCSYDEFIVTGYNKKENIQMVDEIETETFEERCKEIVEEKFGKISNIVSIPVQDSNTNDPNYSLITEKTRQNNKSVIVGEKGKRMLTVRAIHLTDGIEVQFRIFALSSDYERKKLSLSITHAQSTFYTFPIGVKTKTTMKKSNQKINKSISSQIQKLVKSLEMNNAEEVINNLMEIAARNNCFEGLKSKIKRTNKSDLQYQDDGNSFNESNKLEKIESYDDDQSSLFSSLRDHAGNKKRKRNDDMEGLIGRTSSTISSTSLQSPFDSFQCR